MNKPEHMLFVHESSWGLKGMVAEQNRQCQYWTEKECRGLEFVDIHHSKRRQNKTTKQKKQHPWLLSTWKNLCGTLNATSWLNASFE